MSQNLNWKFKAWRRVLEKLENVFAVNTKLSQLFLSLSQFNAFDGCAMS